MIITVWETAERLGVKRNRIYTLLARGSFPHARKNGGGWEVDEVDIERNMHRPQGYPKGRSRVGRRGPAREVAE